MKKSLACALAPLRAGARRPDREPKPFHPRRRARERRRCPLATQLWISNFDGVERPYATAFFQADRAGPSPRRPASTALPADRALYLEKVAAAGETGLLAVDASPRAGDQRLDQEQPRQAPLLRRPAGDHRGQPDRGGGRHLPQRRRA